jgi:NADP-dependent 3-hydroxy acid dehydrogenase YdfG
LSGLGVVLAKAGVHVIAAARRHDALTQVVEEIEDSGGSARAVQLDVSRQDAIEATVAKIQEPIDILVNNA